MAKTGGISGGSRGGGTATLSGGRGFGGGIERGSGSGMTSSFSSRGLASFGKSSESRPSLGSVSKPSLSLEGSKFQSSRSVGNKTGGFMESSARTPRMDSLTESSPAVSLVKENTPKSKAPEATSSNGAKKGNIEVAAVIPQSSANTRLDKLPEFKPHAEATPKSLVSKENVSQSAPFNNEINNNHVKDAQVKLPESKAPQPDANVEQKSDIAVEKVVSPVVSLEKVNQPEVQTQPKEVTQSKVDLEEKVNVPVEKIVPTEVISTPTEAIVEPTAKPEMKVFETVIQEPPVIIRPSIEPTVAPKPEVVVETQAVIEQPAKTVEAPAAPVQKVIAQVVQTRSVAEELKPVIVSKPAVPEDRIIEQNPVAHIETVSVNTRELANLSYLDILPEDDKKTKEKKEKVEAEQRERVAQAYLRAGIVPNIKEAQLKVDRFLQTSPDQLATGRIVEQITTGKVEMQPIKTEPELMTKPEVKVQPGIVTEAQVAPRMQIVTQTNTEMIAVSQTNVEAIASTQTSAKIDAQVDVKPKVEAKSAAAMKAKLIAKEDKKNKKPEIKVDQRALKNRLHEWGNAIRQIFPVWDIEFKAPLREVAAKMVGPDKDTNSGLIYQLGKKVDGSNSPTSAGEDWRTPLITSEAEVTAAQAYLTGVIEIYNKMPVVAKEDGLTATKREVDRVLAGDTDDKLAA